MKKSLKVLYILQGFMDSHFSKLLNEGIIFFFPPSFLGGLVRPSRLFTGFLTGF